jgi:hypothetical protein
MTANEIATLTSFIQVLPELLLGFRAPAQESPPDRRLAPDWSTDLPWFAGRTAVIEQEQNLVNRTKVCLTEAWPRPDPEKN